MEIAILQIKTLPGRRQDVFDALRFIVGQVEIKPDCLKCQIYRAVNDEASFLYIEQWKTKAALQSHIQSPLYKQLLFVMELAVESPEINFYHVSNEESIDMIERLRREF
jgi:quinol monooxygenase YgiN